MSVTVVTDKIIEVVKTILQNDDIRTAIGPESTLVGHNAVLDSMGLVELCLELEDLASDEYGFEFDWTSEKAMSTSKSMFKDIESLAREFVQQMSDSS